MRKNGAINNKSGGKEWSVNADLETRTESLRKLRVSTLRKFRYAPRYFGNVCIIRTFVKPRPVAEQFPPRSNCFDFYGVLAFMESRPPVSLGTAAPFKYRIKPPSLETKLLGRDSRKWAFSFPLTLAFVSTKFWSDVITVFSIVSLYNIIFILNTLHYFEPEDRLL